MKAALNAIPRTSSIIDPSRSESNNEPKIPLACYCVGAALLPPNKLIPSEPITTVAITGSIFFNKVLLGQSLVKHA